MSQHWIRLFRPIVAGATLKDRLFACLGSLAGIAAMTAATAYVVGPDSSLPVIVAPMGASAVLLFVVPTSPMAQPWPVLGGNAISAFVGVAVAQTGLPLALSVSLAVCLAILAMSVTRSLHPPGGAAALTAVIGGQAITDLGFAFPLVPVALNACALLVVGWIFHFAAGRAYPHKTAAGSQPGNQPDIPPRLRTGITPEDVDGALEAVGESFDIERSDLIRLLSEAEWRAAVRTGGNISCSDVMSHHVVTVEAMLPAREARAILLHRNLRTLPVTDPSGRLLGIVGLRQLLADGNVADFMLAAETATPNQRISDIMPLLASGKSHGAVVIDEKRTVLGIVTQTDVLAAMARLAPAPATSALAA